MTAPPLSRTTMRFAAGLVAASFLGCGGGGAGEGPAPAGDRHPVSGRVTAGGKPAAGVQVQLHPLNRTGDATAPRPSGTTDKDGRFALKTDGAEGAPNGQYLATIVWPAANGGDDRLGGAFAEPEGSGLTAVIDDATGELPAFDLNAKAAARPGRR